MPAADGSFALLGRFLQAVLGVRVFNGRLSPALKTSAKPLTQKGATERQTTSIFYASDERFLRSLSEDGDVVLGG